MNKARRSEKSQDDCSDMASCFGESVLMGT